MKTKEELNALKEEVETLNKKLHELTEEELAQISGGVTYEGGFNEGLDLDAVYHSESVFDDVYVEDKSDGIIRNPGDKYFGDR